MYNTIYNKGKSKRVSTMKKKVIIVIGILVAFIVAIAGIASMGDRSDNKRTESSPKVKKSTAFHKDNALDDVKNFAKAGKSTNEIYVTGDIKVSNDSELKPGIYDLQITGGNGNISGQRAQSGTPFINFIGNADGGVDLQGAGSTSGTSKIRLLLFSGDTLKLDNISKVKFTAISQFTPTNQLGQGEYVVGLDIPAGTYKLSSNTKFNSEFDNLGWNIDIWGKNGGNNSQQYNSSSNDVVVKLVDGDVVSTQNTYAGQTPGISPDQEKLIFNKIEQ